MKLIVLFVLCFNVSVMQGAEHILVFENPSAFREISKKINSANVKVECYGLDRFIVRTKSGVDEMDYRRLMIFLGRSNDVDFICLIFQPQSHSLNKFQKKRILKSFSHLSFSRVLVIESFANGLTVLSHK